MATKKRTCHPLASLFIQVGGTLEQGLSDIGDGEELEFRVQWATFVFPMHISHLQWALLGS